MDFGVQLGAAGAHFLTFSRCFFGAHFLEQKKARRRTYLNDPAECAGPLGGRGVRNQQELRCGSSTPQAPSKEGAGGFKALCAFRRAVLSKKVLSHTMPKRIKSSGLARCGLPRPGLQRKLTSCWNSFDNLGDFGQPFRRYLHSGNEAIEYIFQYPFPEVAQVSAMEETNHEVLSGVTKKVQIAGCSCAWKVTVPRFCFNYISSRTQRNQIARK